MARSLSDLMEFDHVIRVKSDGTIQEDVEGVYAPDVNIDAVWDEHGDAHVYSAHQDELIKELSEEGWTMVRPRRAFKTYGSPFLQWNESIGGFLEEDIREESGLYVKVIVEVLAPEGDTRYENESPEPYGWAVLYREEG